MTLAQRANEPDYLALIDVFEACFFDSYRTRLVAGTDEPYYQPGADGEPHQIVFAHGFFSSALHEIAHWCIAGEARRQQFDYGYWYEPDGRTPEQQRLFEQVEVKPQAIEWLFCVCSGRKFQVSVDNLNALESGAEIDRNAFTENVRAQFNAYVANGWPQRAAQFAAALANHYGQPWPVQAQPAVVAKHNQGDLL
ncbi:elongation factor P hydroxylase [Pseudidiomarina sp. PP-1MA]|uniref:Elongation factor P hydroxylase n=4 Tax=Pseudidiomarina TaxID=2800384 RepID=A0AB39X9Y8_9GAMM